MWWNEKYRHAWISRKQLYDQVWSKPRSKLKKEFGISDVMITKICKKHNIPVPSRGYWQKVEAGEKPSPAKLPKQKDEEQIRVRQMINKEPDEIEEPEAETVLQQQAYEEKADNLIVMPAQLTDPLPLIRKTKESLECAKPNENGLVIPRSKEALDISVSPANINHAILIMDTLGKALKARGFQLKHEDGITFAFVHGESITLKLTETLKHIPHVVDLKAKAAWEKENRWTKYRERKWDQIATGRLRLKIMDGSGYHESSTWYTPSKKDPGTCLNECIIELVRNAEDIKEDRRKREQAERDRKAEAERRRLERRAFKTYKANLQRLQEAVGNHDLALKIRRYAEAMEHHARECMGPDYEGSSAAEWITWSKTAADNLDPTKGDECPRVETEDDFNDWWLESEYDHGEFKPQRKTTYNW